MIYFNHPVICGYLRVFAFFCATSTYSLVRAMVSSSIVRARVRGRSKRKMFTSIILNEGMETNERSKQTIETAPIGSAVGGKRQLPGKGVLKTP